jgi:3-phytase
MQALRQTSHRLLSWCRSALPTVFVALAAAACGSEYAELESGVLTSRSSELTATLASLVQMPTLHKYDDAPRTPSSDDPALWLDPNGSGRVLVIATLKEAGLLVYDGEGNVLQTVLPPHRPPLGVDDPPAPGGPDEGTDACPYSTTGEDFSRLNNVDVHYGFKLREHRWRRRIDIAVVSDRGCDTLRIYEIDPDRPGGPLHDITASNVPRVFPTRFEQPSPIQSPGEFPRLVANPLEDENTVYGLTTFQLHRRGPVSAIATQASRSVIAEVVLRNTGDGRITYHRVREYRFDPVFRIRSPHHRPILWSPCREELDEDPQLEGLVVDSERGILYAAQEVVGIWRIRLRRHLPPVVWVSPRALFEKTLTFGAPFWAVPDDDEFSCESEAPDPLPDGTVVAQGDPSSGGEHLAADVEGLTIYDAGHRGGYLIASSQGDNTFHVYDRRHPTRHLGSFMVDGVGDTDGHDVTNLPFGPLFLHGAFVLQNGEAPEPDSTDPINGYEYDGSNRFEIVAWEDIANSLDLVIADQD